MGTWKDAGWKRALAYAITMALVFGLLPSQAFMQKAFAADSKEEAEEVVATPQSEDDASDSVDDQEATTEEPTDGIDGDSVVMVGQRADNPDAIPGDVLDGCTIRLHRKGTHGSLAINGDGHATGDRLLYWNIPDSFRFYLKKADEDSYYFRFFREPDDADYATGLAAECLAVEDTGGLLHNEYDDPNAVFHVKADDGDYTKRFQIIPATDGRFKIMCKESGMYWVLGNKNDNGQLEDGATVHQSNDGDEWNIEIIDAGGSTAMKGNDAPYTTFDKTFDMQKSYDSYTFTYGGETVTASDWMSHLPDDTPLTDLNIPATHDTGTCRMEHGVSTLEAQCQHLFIDDQLTAGVRFLDVRCDNIVNKNGVSSPKLNHTDDCVDRDGEILTANDVLTYTRAFLAVHPGETVIFMVSRQDGDFVNIFNYWEDVAQNSSDFYIGDHVPSLGEVRGKIVLLMKIDFTEPAFENKNPDLIYGNKDGETRQWAFDICPVKGHTPFDTAGDAVLVRQARSYDVWIQDDYKSSAEDKWTDSTLNSLNNAPKHRDDTIAMGKYAWIINYTSCSAFFDDGTTPLSGARYTNHLVKEYFDKSYSNTFDTSATNGKYVGVVPMDFVDEQQCQLVYRQNFIMASMPKVIEGKGTEDDPYIINDAITWNDFANIVNAGATDVHAKMAFYVSGVTTMVGTEKHPFTGVFDGGGYTLQVSIDGNEEAVAPFHWVGGATIKNVRVEGDVKGKKHTGGLVGYMADGTVNAIEDVTVSSTVQMADQSYCAGIVGHVKRSDTTLRRCIFEGSIQGGEYVGALVGWGDNGCAVTLDNCLEKGKAYTATNVNPIGLFSDWGTVTDTYALRNVKGSPRQNYEGVVKVYVVRQPGENIEVVACDGNTYYLPVEVEVSLSTNRKSVSLDADKLKEKAVALFSADELEQVKNGAKLKVWLEVQVVDDVADVPADDAKLLQKRAGELGSTPGEYALITLYKQVGDGKAETITELPSGMAALHLSWSVPEKLRASGRTFDVMSVHNGKVLEHESTTKNNEVSFDVAKLSTFTLAHKDASGEEPAKKQSASSAASGSLAKTGDTSIPVALAFILAAVGMLCLIWGGLVRRSQRQ